jgi:hypothetical protein
MDRADELMTAIRLLQAASATADAWVAQAEDRAHTEAGVLPALHEEADRLRSELARLRREYTAEVADFLRCC